MANRFDHATHFTVASFGNRDPVPAIGTFTATGFDGAKLGDAVIQRDAIEQFALLLGAEVAQDPHGVFTLKSKPGMHQVVGQAARIGEQQQAFGVQVEPANGLPFALMQFGQSPEHRGAVLRIVVRDDFARGLVIRNDPGGRRVNTHPDRLAVDFDMVAKLDPLSDVGRFVIDGDAPFNDELLHLEP